MRTKTTPNGSFLSNATSSEETVEQLPSSDSVTKIHHTNFALPNPADSEVIDDPPTRSKAPPAATRVPVRETSSTAHSLLRKYERHTEVMITIQSIHPGRPKHVSARVLAFDTLLEPKECLGLLQAIADLMRAYPRKEHPHV